MLDHRTATGFHTETQRRFIVERDRDGLRRAAQEGKATSSSLRGLMAAVKAKLSTGDTVGAQPKPAV